MTRLLLTCFLVTGLGALVGVLPYTHMYLDWHYLLRVPPQVRTVRRAAKRLPMPGVLQAAAHSCTPLPTCPRSGACSSTSPSLARPALATSSA